MYNTANKPFRMTRESRMRLLDGMRQHWLKVVGGEVPPKFDARMVPWLEDFGFKDLCLAVTESAAENPLASPAEQLQALKHFLRDWRAEDGTPLGPSRHGGSFEDEYDAFVTGGE